MAKGCDRLSIRHNRNMSGGPRAHCTSMARQFFSTLRQECREEVEAFFHLLHQKSPSSPPQAAGTSKCSCQGTLKGLNMALAQGEEYVIKSDQSLDQVSTRVPKELCLDGRLIKMVDQAGYSSHLTGKGEHEILQGFVKDPSGGMREQEGMAIL